MKNKNKKVGLDLVRQFLHDQMLKEAEDDENKAEVEGPPAPEGPSVEGNDSLDAQVDHYLSGYEAEATNAVTEGNDLRAITQRFLFEAPGDDDEEDEEDAAGDTEVTPAAPAAPSKKSLGEIDVRSYAGGIARLITNINSLIETRNTILRRAVNHLGKTYDPMVIRQLEIILEDEHGLAIDKSERDIEDDLQVPPAANAGPLGG